MDGRSGYCRHKLLERASLDAPAKRGDSLNPGDREDKQHPSCHSASLVQEKKAEARVITVFFLLYLLSLPTATLL